MKRLRIEVLRFLEARDLLLGIGLVDVLWHQAAEDVEVWSALLAADFGAGPKAASRLKYARYTHSHCYAVHFTEQSLRLYRLPSMTQYHSIPVHHQLYKAAASMPAICYLKSASLLFSGGRLCNESYNTVLELQATDGTFVLRPSMLERRYGHGTIQSSGAVFCFGGGTDPLVGHAANTAEQFSLATSSWRGLPHMLSHRMLFSPAKRHKKIYLLGGCWTRNCELFDVENERFEALAVSIPFKSAPCCSISIENELYLFTNSGLWKCQFPLSSGFSHVLDFDEDEIPYSFTAAIRVKGSVYLYGDNSTVHAYSLQDCRLDRVLEPAVHANTDETEEMTESPDIVYRQEVAFSPKTRDLG